MYAADDGSRRLGGEGRLRGQRSRVRDHPGADGRSGRGRRAAPSLRSEPLRPVGLAAARPQLQQPPHADTPGPWRTRAHRSTCRLRRQPPSATLDMTPQPANRANRSPASAAAPSTNVGGPVNRRKLRPNCGRRKPRLRGRGCSPPISSADLGDRTPRHGHCRPGLALTNVLQF